MMPNSPKATLSPSQQAVLNAIAKDPVRYLPRGAVIDTRASVLLDAISDLKDEVLASILTVLGCRWEWSWTILQEAHTADYRRRIWEINQMAGYKIISFHAPWTGMFGGGYVKTITRHGYILVPPSKVNP